MDRGLSLFPALDLLKEGYEVYTIVDAVGGTSRLAHETALRRMEQAGVQLTSVTQYICELQRDWNRKETVPVFFQGLLDNGSFLWKHSKKNSITDRKVSGYKRMKTDVTLCIKE